MAGHGGDPGCRVAGRIDPQGPARGGLLVVHREQCVVDSLGVARPRVGTDRAAGGVVCNERAGREEERDLTSAARTGSNRGPGFCAAVATPHAKKIVRDEMDRPATTVRGMGTETTASDRDDRGTKEVLNSLWWSGLCAFVVAVISLALAAF